MSDVKTLYERLRALPRPSLANRIGDFPLYESLLAGCADRVARGGLLDLSRVPAPDAQTATQVEQLRRKADRTEEESAFLEYFDLLEELRSTLSVGGARTQQQN
jgi:hypothetical protein